MRQLLKLLITLFISVTCFAQQGINYKALIKDDLGNIIAAQDVTMRFTILEDVNNVYQETHALITSANGIAVVNIGEGSIVSGDFSAIAWGNNEHFLKVEIDVSGGTDFIEIGTTKFKTVPYALNNINENWKQTEETITNTNTGNIGFGIANPKVKFHFASGEFFLFGNDTIGQGSKIMYHPDRHAFRIGTLNSAASSVYWNNQISFEDKNFLGVYSFATGLNTRAQGFGATAMGGDTEGFGNYSMATGYFTNADGDYSTAMGFNTDALGLGSTALGYNSDALGDYSTSMGRGTEAKSRAETAIGQYNTSYTPLAEGPDDWNTSDRLFIIGNGVSDNNRSDALTVLKNGKTGIGRSNPSSLLEVAHSNSPPTASDYSNAFSIHNIGTGSSWQFSTVNAGHLSIYKNGSYRGFFNEATGIYGSISDRRTKKDIKPIENGTLNKVMQLNPVSYLMKEQTDTKRNMGLISQEVQEIFPSITNYVEESDLLALSYTELIPILIKALQEQQNIINEQHNTSEAHKAKDIVQDKYISEQGKTIETLIARLDSLESKSSN